MFNFNKSMAVWVIIIVVIIFVVQGIKPEKIQNLEFSEFLAKVEGGQIKKCTVMEDKIVGEISNGAETSNFRTSINPESVDVVLNELKAYNDAPDRKPEEKIEYGQYVPNRWWGTILGNFFLVVFFVAIFIFMMRQMQAGGTKAMSFGKSRAKMLNENQNRITFDDVAGIDEAKEDLKEIVEFLKDSQKFRKLGAKIPKGVLLFGPPGTGKTLLARAIAGEANVPFFSISGSDFVEMFVGVGASRVRDLFEQGKKNAPCLIFMDEIDAVGRHRFAGIGGGHDEREQTLNQLLVEMDGFNANEGVILIAATNRPDVLDPALLRPGRFDRQIVVDPPDQKGREGIFKVHTKNIVMDKSVDLSVMGRRTPGFSGADIANCVNEAALLAARKGKDSVEMIDFEEAIDRVVAGPERKSRMISEKEKKIISYHECGHALMSLLVDEIDPLHKVSILSRGRALGYTLSLPLDDKYLITKKRT